MLSGLLIITMASAQSQELSPPQQLNLMGLRTLCITGIRDNVNINDYGWLDTSLPEELVDTMRNKLTAYRIPIKTDAKECDTPTYYMTIYVDATKSIAGGYRAVKLTLFVDGWGMANGISDAKIWEDGYLYVTSKNQYDFGTDLKYKLGEFVDRFAADWVKSH